MVHKEMKDCQQLLHKAEGSRKPFLEVFLKRADTGFSFLFCGFSHAFLSVFWTVYVDTQETNVKFEIAVMGASNMALQCLFHVLVGFSTIGLLNAVKTQVCFS